jgi:hypothetical protein
MNKKFFVFLSIAVVVLSCGIPVAATPTSAPPPTVIPTDMPPTKPADVPLPTVTPVCISPEPTQRDIDRALSFTNTTFDAPGWERSYTVAESRVSVTWLNNAQGAIVYLEAIIFPCSYEEPDLNNYYSDENWKTIFQNYEGYELLDECKTNAGTRLYEFKTQNQGFEYEIKYWVQNDTDTRVISTMIVFPLESKLLLDEYSSMLFPGYSTCP